MTTASEVFSFKTIFKHHIMQYVIPYTIYSQMEIWFWIMIQEGRKIKQSQHILMHCTSSCFDDLKKTTG
jgi:hypothetical protein